MRKVSFLLELPKLNLNMAINEARALDALGGDSTLLVELANIFAEDAPNALEKLRSAVDKNDFSAALSETHSIKGLVSTFFAKSVVDLAQRLESEAASEKLELFRNGGFEELSQNIEAIILDFKSRGWVDSNSYSS